MPLIGSNRYQCQDVSDASFRSYMRENTPELQVAETLLTHEEPENAYAVIRDIIAAEPGLRGYMSMAAAYRASCGRSGAACGETARYKDRLQRYRPGNAQGLNEG